MKQENQQVNTTLLSDKQSSQETRLQLEGLRTLYAEVSTKLSASLSNEGGLNTRLSERNTQIDALNQQLQTLNQSQAGYQSSKIKKSNWVKLKNKSYNLTSCVKSNS